MAAFLEAITAWLAREPAVASAVLFGSSASADAPVSAGASSDFDLHVISDEPSALEKIDWPRALPEVDFVFQSVRPATGGVRKVTALFTSGQIDLVIVPRRLARKCALLIWTGGYVRSPAITVGLNEMATCINTGYRFLKGEDAWGRFYARVAQQMPGVRVGDPELGGIADSAVIDCLWVRQKLSRGELIAAQHVLHRQISEANLRLYRELRLRRGLSLRSFGLGRRVETTGTPEDIRRLSVNARLDRSELADALTHALQTLQWLMAELVPAWSMPEKLRQMVLPESKTQLMSAS